MRVFNRIRRILLEKLKIRSYLLYAIGEILLITVGVLIALYINNWNQDMKSSAEEQAILNTLRENFRSNKREIDATLQEYKTALRIAELRIEQTGPGADLPAQSVLDSIVVIDYVQLPYISGGSAPALSDDKITVLSSKSLVIALNRLPIQYNRYRATEQNVNALVDRLREIHQQHVALLGEEMDLDFKLTNSQPHPSEYRAWLRDRMNQNKSVEHGWKLKAAIASLEQLEGDNVRILELIGT